MEIEKKLFSIKEASKLLSVSEVSLYRHTKSGRVPSTRIVGRVMIPAAYIKAAEAGESGE